MAKTFPHLLPLGHAMRRRRLDLGLTQEELADHCHLTRNYIGTLERGERNPTVEKLMTIAASLEIRLDDLVRDLADSQDPTG